jgi:4,5-DOPA dioxygenase extradiol
MQALRSGAVNMTFERGGSNPGRMPVLFIGHGSPENAGAPNAYNRVWRQLGRDLPRPRLILSLSAHWVVHEGTAVTAMERPKTIHDFFGFPPDLYAIEYDAPGSPEDATLIRHIVQSIRVDPDLEWGLDHGTWSVLTHMYPEADIPVIQLSLNYNHPLPLHYRIGRELAVLRDQGVLIIGSGNLVHNLMMLRMGQEPYAWATGFDQLVKDRILAGDYQPLVNFSGLSNARLAHPTSEHYLPLIYILGAAGNDLPRFFNEDIFAGSVSMRGIVFGEASPVP